MLLDTMDFSRFRVLGQYTHVKINIAGIYKANIYIKMIFPSKNTNLVTWAKLCRPPHFYFKNPEPQCDYI